MNHRVTAEPRTSVGHVFNQMLVVIKVKVGRSKLADDVNLIRSLREELGSDVIFRLDANQAWSLDEAMRFCNEVGPDRIEVVVHPGSIVHSLVEFVDGALLAQLGTPDMRVPLQYAVSGEKHWPLATGTLDLLKTGSLRFEAPDTQRFPCLRLAREAGKAAGSAPIVLNAANEIAVEALLAGRIRYGQIAQVIEDSLASEPQRGIADLAAALDVDKQARRTAAGHIDRRSGSGE